MTSYENDTLKSWSLGSYGNKELFSSNRKSTYYLKDHKGSVRVSIDDANTITSAQDYFPYRKIMHGFEVDSRQPPRPL